MATREERDGAEAADRPLCFGIASAAVLASSVSGALAWKALAGPSPTAVQDAPPSCLGIINRPLHPTIGGGMPGRSELPGRDPAASVERLREVRRC